MGYHRNEYYWCVMNKTVNELNMSHVDYDIDSSILADIDTEYGKIVKMTITWGKIHKYLGMTIDQSFPGKVILSMVNYIGKILNNILEYMIGGIINTGRTPPF